MTKLTWLGHGTWQIETGGQVILVDPFLDDSPTAPVNSDEVSPGWILVSHGHYDHVADAVKIARRTGAAVVSNFEICQWCSQQGVGRTEPMNLGGNIRLPWGQVKLTLAHHSSVLPDGTHGGHPGGFLLTLADARVYFACDTALFLDMKLIGDVGLDLAVVPIGDRYTMGPEDSVEALKLLRPRRAVPSHYNTWPPIAQDVQVWVELVRRQTGVEPLVPKPGEAFVV
jgi:L-ascorbate metabolism protein UlaG (beta-lactamase superfamily)